MRAVVATLLILFFTTLASADCRDTLEYLYDQAHQFDPRSMPSCNDAPDKAACQASRCSDWDEVRIKFATELSKNELCAEIIARQFPGLIAELETKRIQCNSLQDPLPTPQAGCLVSAEIFTDSLNELANHWRGDTCNDCPTACVAFRDSQAKITSLSAACRNMIVEALKDVYPNMVTEMQSMNVLCTGIGQ